MKILLASSNPGKLREYRELAEGTALQIDSLPNFQEISKFEESAPTFGENAVGKALHYGRYAKEAVLADDSGLVVPALGGAPGVYSAGYAGPNGTDADCVRKLLHEMAGKQGDERRARFVCVITVVKHGRVLVVVSDFVAGGIANEPRGANGFGYDPVFYFPDARRTFAEIAATEKNRNSHRGKAFRKAVEYLTTSIF
jgi:non-canonical purine NTP pyrophosphatase (RdgB/HAM1 family)